MFRGEGPAIPAIKEDRTSCAAPSRFTQNPVLAGIAGLGNDIVEIARIKAIIARYPQRFLNRIFTSKEQEYCLKRKEPSLHFAGRFAAKEAIVKALGTGFSHGLSWQDFEILPNEHGKPDVKLSSSAANFFGQPCLLVSISHCTHYATAVAIWVQTT